MKKRIRETHYSLRSTFFSNNYEDPGEEFDIDPEDPVGLVSSRKRMELQDEIHGDTVPGITYESFGESRYGLPHSRRGIPTRELEVNRMMSSVRPRNFRITESQVRYAARRAETMSDAQLMYETVVLTEFIGKILKAIASPFKMIRNVLNKGLFQSIGDAMATVVKKSIGGQKDLDRKAALEGEREALEAITKAQAGDASGIDLTSDQSKTFIYETLVAYANELNDLSKSGDSVFPNYGLVNIGGKGPDDKGNESSNEADRKRFVKEQIEVNNRLKDLVVTSGKVRGMLFAIRNAYDEKGVKIRVNEAVITPSYPLDYVTSNLRDIQSVFSAVDDDIEGDKIPSALDAVENATQTFVQTFTPQLDKLSRKMFESAVARVVVNRAALQKRRLID